MTHFDSIESTPNKFNGVQFYDGIENTLIKRFISEFNFFCILNQKYDNCIFQQMKNILSDTSIQVISISIQNYRYNKYLVLCFEKNCFILLISTPDNYYKEIVKCLLNRKIYLLFAYESDYQNFQNLFLGICDQINNFKYFSRIDSILQFSIESIMSDNKFKHKNKMYPVFNLSIKSIIAFIIGRFYFKNKYFKDPSFFDIRLSNSILKNDDFIFLYNLDNKSTKVDLVLHIDSLKIFVKKIVNNNNTREKFIYDIIREYDSFATIIGCIYNGNIIESIILEYMSKGDLKKYIQQLKLNQIKNQRKYETKKIIILTQIIDQLTLLHKKNIIYRDIKPDNIAIDHNNKIRIIDYDFSVQFEDDHIMSQDIGSPSYIAPESCLGEYSYKSDVFMFGCLIFFVYKGNHLFDSNKKDLNKIYENEITNEDVRQIYVKCLNVNPNLRPSSEMILQNFLLILLKIGMNKNDISKLISKENINLLNNLDLPQNYQQPTLNYNKEAKYFFLMGLQMFCGIICPQNVENSLKFFSLAAEKGYSEAQFFLGKLLFDGLPEYRNIKQALYYLHLAANQNHPQSLSLLSKIYFEGIYVNQDIRKAIYFLHRSAELKDPFGLLLLASLYMEGQYVKKDFNKVIEYLSYSADQNYIYAQFYLGQILCEGKIVTRNVNKGIELLIKSANQNYSEAQYLLGRIFHEGRIVIRDVDRSIYYLKQAANQNHSFAQFLLGYIYSTEPGFIKLNKAYHYLQISSNQNNCHSLYYLAQIYLDNKLVKRDINKAMYYLERASLFKHPIAQYQLGLIYYNGNLVKKDLTKAIHYLKLAANQLHSNAAYYLAYIYYFDALIGHDVNKVKYYLCISSKLGNAHADCLSGVLYHEGIYEIKNMEKSIINYKNASNKNSNVAQNNLGVIYLNGEGCKKNIYDAVLYFNKGINVNDVLCLYNMARILYFGIDNYEKNKNKAINYLETAANKKLSIANIFLYYIKSDDAYKKEKYDPFVFFEMYDLLYGSDMEFVNHFFDYLKTGKIQKKSYQYYKDLDNHKRKNIDQSFYDGFYN